MKAILVLGALLMAASASAQDEAPKVWTDADLAKPLPSLNRQPDPAVVAAMKARADYIPNRGVGAGAAIRVSSALSAPAPPDPVEARYARELAAERANARRVLQASQPQPLYPIYPLYPFATFVYSNRPHGPISRRPACPMPPVFSRRYP